MSDFTDALNHIAAEPSETARLDAVRKLAGACETACELLSVSFHVAGYDWSDHAQTEVDTILRDRALEITHLEVPA